MSIDYEHFQSFATMPATPHVLVIPSDFKQFIKVIFSVRQMEELGFRFQEILSGIKTIKVAL